LPFFAIEAGTKEGQRPHEQETFAHRATVDALTAAGASCSGFKSAMNTA
jgi:hypothetical protein